MKIRILSLPVFAASLLAAGVFTSAALAQPTTAPRGRGPQGPQVVSPEVAADGHVTFRILAPRRRP